MAAELSISVIAELTGLGMPQTFIDKATDGTTPTAYTKNYRVLDTADTEEALDLGDVSTISCILIRAIDGDLLIDCDFDTTFNSDLTVKEGEIPALIPYPAGDVYVKNGTALETPTYEFLVIGTV